jgi:hypothetical protein
MDMQGYGKWYPNHGVLVCVGPGYKETGDPFLNLLRVQLVRIPAVLTLAIVILDTAWMDRSVTDVAIDKVVAVVFIRQAIGTNAIVLLLMNSLLALLVLLLLLAELGFHGASNTLGLFGLGLLGLGALGRGVCDHGDVQLISTCGRCGAG